MQKLSKMLIIHWHAFSKEVLEFSNINFLTGKNAAGKSTVVDALQLALLGDTRGSSFNKAAGEKASRSLISYLRGEIGESDGARKYLRNGEFASYILLEFHNTVTDRYMMVGFQFDIVNEKVTNHPVIINAPIPENCFIEKNKPMKFKEFKDYVVKNYPNAYTFPDSLTSYRDALRNELGHLSEKYFQLFKRAVPFQPLYDIPKFITEYICEVRYDVKTSVEKMQENIREYHDLEHEAKVMIQKVEALKKIDNEYQSYFNDRIQSEQDDFLTIKLEEHNQNLQIKKLKDQIVNNEDKIAVNKAEYEERKLEFQTLSNDRDILIARRESSGAQAHIRELSRDKEFVEKQIHDIKEIYDNSLNRLKSTFTSWYNKASLINLSHIDAGCYSRLGLVESNFKTLVEEILNETERFTHIDGSRLNKYSQDSLVNLNKSIAKLDEQVYAIRHHYENIERELNERRNQLNAEVQAMKVNGTKPYNPRYLQLKADLEKAISESINKKIKIDILADLIEVKDQKWQNALETYLHGQKLQLVIDPKYFEVALKIYDSNRNYYSSLGLIDIEKVIASAPKCEQNSLATEIETTHAGARAYIDYLIGRLMKAERVEDLRNYSRSITPTCIVYQNFAVRSLTSGGNTVAFIGRKAVESQIFSAQEEIAKIDNELESIRNKRTTFYNINHFETFNEHDMRGYYNNLMKIYELDRLEANIDALDEDITNIDTSDIDSINEQITEINYQMQQMQQIMENINLQVGILTEKNREIELTKIPHIFEDIKEIKLSINKRFNQEWIEKYGNQERISAFMELPASDQKAHLADLKQRKMNLSSKKKKLDDARRKYNHHYNTLLEADDDLQINQFKIELVRFEEVTLPQYVSQIKEAKDNAYEQFKEELLSKLKANIDSIYEQIDQLNLALKQFQFGRDSYNFLVSPNNDYMRFYDMIMDDIILQEYKAGFETFFEKHNETIEELFKAITEAPGINEAEKRALVERNIERFTDYRTYLTFDLIVTNNETNTSTSLARSMGTKSGGETQTPFYISILASIANEYRINDSQLGDLTPRLIVFDEAFSKMDSERIKQSIELLKQFNLQALLIAPPEKVADIAPLVDRNLCVVRKRNVAFVKWFDKESLYDTVAV